MVVINERALEVLKVWYSVFAVVMDAPESEISNVDKLNKLYKLRSRLKIEAPELEELGWQPEAGRERT